MTTLNNRRIMANVNLKDSDLCELRTYIEESLKEINGECSKFSTEDEYEELLNKYHRHIAELEAELQAFSKESLMFIFYVAANSHKFPLMAGALRKIYE